MMAAQLDVPMISLYVMKGTGLMYHTICKREMIVAIQNIREIALALCQTYVRQLEEVLSLSASMV